MLHKFPLDKNRQTLWVESIQNFQPSYIMKKSHYVCQCHFLSTDYELNNLLKKTAVPFVFSEFITLLPYTIFEDKSNFPSQFPCDPNTSKNLAEELECYPLQLMKSNHNQSNSSKSPLKTNVKQDFAVIKKSCSPRKCFIGDFDVQDLNSPRKRLRYWSESQNTIKKYKREILLTKKKNKRLLNKIKSYRQLINHLKYNNYISDCYSVIKVKTTNK
ncbi:unnamed protein product [Macrosiphum euphorbiae]|uniref:THAP-type domain-containing protein n=1 Tax=Macrosiphum euphorbiae TaxID=13131 RepID=A0AAV0WFA1_9HEMI|nr:unnamed protein product [Macrosiphum euphorbiae]